jgi:cyclophilin family peptidyl-prolyl cis-trans isomerase
MRRRLALILVCALVVTACGDDAGPPVTAPAYEGFRAQPTACGAAAPPPARSMQFTVPDDMQLTGNVVATVHTSCGSIVLELVPQLAPQTVNSFVFLADRGYFDGTAVHRVVPGFVIQAGDPTGSGTGGPGYRLPDELPPQGFVYGPGVVAMANAGPDTSGSQFFIVIGDTGLDARFSVFGVVVDGVETLARIVAVPLGVGPGGFEPSRPLETIYIERVEIDGR